MRQSYCSRHTDPGRRSQGPSACAETIPALEAEAVRKVHVSCECGWCFFTADPKLLSGGGKISVFLVSTMDRECPDWVTRFLQQGAGQLFIPCCTTSHPSQTELRTAPARCTCHGKSCICFQWRLSKNGGGGAKIIFRRATLNSVACSAFCQFVHAGLPGENS